MTENPYKILQIPPSASDATIRLAYKKLIKLHHPDHSQYPSSGDAASKIIAAYAAIKDQRACGSEFPSGRSCGVDGGVAPVLHPIVGKTLVAERTGLGVAQVGRRLRFTWYFIIASIAILIAWGSMLMPRPLRVLPTAEAQSLSDALASHATVLDSQINLPVDISAIVSAKNAAQRIWYIEGSVGLDAYSQFCFRRQALSRSVSDFDRCVAFDYSSRILTERNTGQRHLVGGTGRSPGALAARHLRAGRLIDKDAHRVVERLEWIALIVSAQHAQDAGPSRRAKYNLGLNLD